MAEETPEARKARQDALKERLKAQRAAREAAGGPVNRVSEISAAEKRMRDEREAEEELRAAREKQAADMKKAQEEREKEAKPKEAGTKGSKMDWSKVAGVLKKGGVKLKSGLGSAASKAKGWMQARQAAKAAAPPPSPSGGGILSKLGGAGSKGYAAGAMTAGAVLTTVGAAYGAAKSKASAAKAAASNWFNIYNVLFILTLVWHAVDLTTDFSMAYTRIIFFFLIIAPIAWIYIYGSETGIDGLRTPFIVSFIAVISPIILLNRYVFDIIHLPTIFKSILLFFPVWPVFIMFGLPKTTLTKWMGLFYIIIILGLFFSSTMVYSVANDFGIDQMKVGMLGFLYDTVDKIAQGGTRIITTIAEIPKTVSKTAQQQIQYATGDYYTGQVEKGKNEPVGVYIENVEPSDPEFAADQAVIVWATLKAKTLDPDKEITVTASCYGDGGQGNKVYGDADPTDTASEVYVMKTKAEEQKDITCEFKPNSFEKGARQVFIDADFNFVTMSYIKAYFMDLTTLRAMRQESIDPLTQYGITDKKPVAVFTNGPVALNMETIADQPIGVSTETPREIRLGVTIENRWEGMIKTINGLTIKVPPGLEVVYCDHSFKKVACQEAECEDGKYTSVYKFTQESSEGRRGLADTKDIKSYQSFVCRLQLDSKEKLLGTLPLATQYFKATADYVYQLEKGTIVNIKPALGGGTGTGGATGTTRPASFDFNPSSSQVTVKKGQQKAFSVRITNPGTLSYGWKVTGVKEDSSPAQTSYIFSSDVAGDAKVTFSAFGNKGETVQEKVWDVTVTE